MELLLKYPEYSNYIISILILINLGIVYRLFKYLAAGRIQLQESESPQKSEKSSKLMTSIQWTPNEWANAVEKSENENLLEILSNQETNLSDNKPGGLEPVSTFFEEDTNSKESFTKKEETDLSKLVDGMADSQIIYILMGEDDNLKALVIPRLPDERAEKILKNFSKVIQSHIMKVSEELQIPDDELSEEIIEKFSQKVAKAPRLPEFTADGINLINRLKGRP